MYLTGPPKTPAGIVTSTTFPLSSVIISPVGNNSQGALAPLKICSNTGILGSMKDFPLIVNLPSSVLNPNSKLTRLSAPPGTGFPGHRSDRKDWREPSLSCASFDLMDWVYVGSETDADAYRRIAELTPPSKPPARIVLLAITLGSALIQ